MKKIIYALRFMTKIPIKWEENENLEEVAKSISLFPIVGLIIGLSNFLVFYLSNQFFSPIFSSVLTITWWVYITGGLHLDGLADTADGIWGGASRKKRLEIMNDSRIGVFGVLSLLLFLLLKIGIVHELMLINNTHLWKILIIAPILGRWISVFSIYTFKTAKKEGLGSFFKKYITIKELLVSMVLSLVLIFSLMGLIAILVFLIVTLFSILCSLFFKSKLGGLSGDIYGTLCEVTELIALLSFFILFSLGIR